MRKKFLILLVTVGLICTIVTCANKILNKTEETVAIPEPPTNSKWKITPMSSQGKEQMMGYVIEGDIDGLLIIDGGYRNVQGEVNNILDVIKKHNNIVDAWIVTHLDADHVGVYLNIVENHPEIKIKQVYTSFIAPLDKCKEKDPLEGDWSNYEDFIKYRINNNDIKILSEGDKIEDIIGLKMEVFWAYSDWVYENCPNLLNNGSLVFKLIAKEESMIFFADVRAKNVAEKIIAKYGDKLKAEYVQIGHHGNNDFPNEIYDIIQPHTAFIPAPDWIFENPNKVSWFTASKIRKLLQDKGIKVYSDKDCPISVIMK